MRLVRYAGVSAMQVGPTLGTIVEVDSNLPAFSRTDPAAADLIRSTWPQSGGSWIPLIGAWSAVEGPLEAFEEAATRALAAGDEAWNTRVLAGRDLDAPLPSPASRVFAAGGNFATHVAQAFGRMSERPVNESEIASEKERGLPPWGFLVIPDLLCGNDMVVTPPADTRFLDYEAEVAVILASGGRNLQADEVRFWGASVFHDFSLRDGARPGATPIDRGPLVWGLQKNWESGKSMGPWVVVGHEFRALDVQGLPIECLVDGEQRQSSSTSAMIYSFSEIAAYISRYVHLQAGDVIASGTPAGTAMDTSDERFLKSGQVVIARVGPIGELRARVGTW